MYSIILDGNTIYHTGSPSEDLKLLNAILDLEENNAGTLSITFPPNHPALDILEMYSSTIHVYKDDVWIWGGRTISDVQTDIYGQVSVTFDGALSFLNDTHQESVIYNNYTLSQFITKLLEVHNSKVNDDRKIYPGTIDVDDGTNDRYSEYEVTLEAINDIIEDTEGHLRLRYVNNKFYLDYLKDYRDSNGQYINFGENLLDYNSTRSMENFATVIFPLGKEDDNGNRLTVESVNSGSKYVVNKDAVAKYGWIEKMYDSTEIETASALLSYAKGLLTKSVQNLELELDISAIDLHNLDNSIEAISLLDKVRVISTPHGIDMELPVVNLSFDLCDPASDTFTLGTVVSQNLTSVNGSIQDKVYKSLGDVPKDKTVLEQARDNATSLIRSATTGYVTVRPDAIYISDKEDYTQSTKLWTWNMNGLGYSNDGGKTYGIAITMDGAIVADYITTGTMSAERIKGGSITSLNNNTTWNLNTGLFTMRSGAIGLGRVFNTSESEYNYSFTVENTGSVVSRNDSTYSMLYNGTLYFGRFDDTRIRTGYIDGTVRVHNLTDDTYRYGLNIVASYRNNGSPSVIRLVSDEISVSQSNDSSDTSTTCGTGSIKVLNQDTNTYWTLRFINGLCVTNFNI